MRWDNMFNSERLSMEHDALVAEIEQTRRLVQDGLAYPGFVPDLQAMEAEAADLERRLQMCTFAPVKYDTRTTTEP